MKIIVATVDIFTAIILIEFICYRLSQRKKQEVQQDPFKIYICCLPVRIIEKFQTILWKIGVTAAASSSFDTTSFLSIYNCVLNVYVFAHISAPTLCMRLNAYTMEYFVNRRIFIVWDSSGKSMDNLLKCVQWPELNLKIKNTITEEDAYERERERLRAASSISKHNKQKMNDRMKRANK